MTIVDDRQKPSQICPECGQNTSNTHNHPTCSIRFGDIAWWSGRTERLAARVAQEAK